MDAEEVNQVRLYVLRTAMDGQGVPPAPQTATALGIREEHAVEAYRRLAEGHVYVLEPGDPTRLRMANPFSAVPTAHEVHARGKTIGAKVVNARTDSTILAPKKSNSGGNSVVPGIR